MYCTCDIPMTGPGFGGACMNCARPIRVIQIGGEGGKGPGEPGKPGKVARIENGRLTVEDQS